MNRLQSKVYPKQYKKVIKRIQKLQKKCLELKQKKHNETLMIKLQQENIHSLKEQFELMKEDKTFILNELDIANQYIHIANIRVVKYQFYKVINGIDLSLHELNYLLFSLYHWKRNFKLLNFG